MKLNPYHVMENTQCVCISFSKLTRKQSKENEESVAKKRLWCVKAALTKNTKTTAGITKERRLYKVHASAR